jgi:hypothetical protein
VQRALHPRAAAPVSGPHRQLLPPRRHPQRLRPQRRCAGAGRREADRAVPQVAGQRRQGSCVARARPEGRRQLVGV